jgi:hypothetical protein
MRPYVKQALGPPNATPERLTPAKRNVELLDDAVFLLPAIAQRKSYHRPYRGSLLAALTAEFRELVILIETAGPTSRQRDVGAGSRAQSGAPLGNGAAPVKKQRLLRQTHQHLYRSSKQGALGIVARR